MKKAHIIGIAGLGMTALATYLKKSGWNVTGSDAGSYDPSKTYLNNAGISYNTQYAAENIPHDADLIIIGKHAKLTKDNPEIVAALDSGKEITTMAEMWGRLSAETDNTVVIGSYGKSTCTALIAHCLQHAGKDPNYFIGAVPYDMELSHPGKDNTFVMEGDEYPTSNFDMTSKFLYFKANNVLLTSGEHDHVNMFPTIESYLKPYQEFLKKLSQDNTVVAAINHPNVTELINETDAKVVTYAMDATGTYHPENITYGETTTLTLKKGDEKIIDLSTSLLGRHNIENIIGVSALLLEQKMLTSEELAQGIASFKGLKRRLDLLTKKSTVKVFEGFGSSYRKAKTIIEALNLHFPEKKIHVVFEPHTFSWRDPKMSDWYDDVFDGSESVAVLQPPAKDGKDIAEQLSLQDIVKLIQKNIPQTIGATEAESVLTHLRENVQKHDVIVILSSGEAAGLIKSIPAWCEETFGK
jgi:UDP-N-acetylmuramate: L-alanyl-gamma-D-glutamyl-meso-diaminopimelate ligase